jgi:pilus assembly protein Flp/PilA
MHDPIIRFVITTIFRAQDGAKRLRNEEGATAVEYGLLIGFIAAAIVVAVTLIGTKLSGFFLTVGSKI